MISINRDRPADRLDEFEHRFEAQRRHLDRLERRLAAGPTVGRGWECSHCARGWVLESGDTLECTSCGYLRYL